MAGGADVIKEFLVAIGFKTDEASFKKFNNQIKMTTEVVLKLGAVATEAATLVELAVERVASGLEDLYFSSQRTNSTVQNIQAIGYAASQIGLSMQGGQGALESFSRALRNSPGLTGFLNQLGVATQGRQNADIFTDVLKQLSKLPPYIANQLAQLVGIDENTLTQFRNNREAFAAAEEDRARRLKESGVATENLSAASNVFMTDLRRLGDEWGILESKIAQDFLPIADKVINWLEQAIEWFLKLDVATNGWASTLAMLAATLGAGAGTIAVLGRLAGAFGLLGGGVAAVGEAAVATTPVLAALAAAGAPILAIAAALAGVGYLAYRAFSKEGQQEKGISKVPGYARPGQPDFKSTTGASPGTQAVIDAGESAASGIGSFFGRIFTPSAPGAGAHGKVAPPAAAAVPAGATADDYTAGSVTAPPSAASGIGSFFSGIFKPTELGAGAHGKTAPRDGSTAETGASAPRSGSFQQQAIDYFLGQGWTEAQAAGIVANIKRESSFNAGKIGDHGAAFGLGQWHEDRQAAFARWAGHGIKDSTFAEQLAFVQYELTHDERRAGSNLRSAQSPEEAGGIVSSQYERPLDTFGEAALRGQMAGDIFRTSAPLGGTTQVAAAPVITQTNTTTINGATDPAATAKAVGSAQTRVNGDLVRNLQGAIQ